MIIGLPLWAAALDIANSSLAKKVPYSIALASEHMATDPISIVGQVKDISSISIKMDFDETLDKLHRCTLKVHLPSGEPLKVSREASKKQQAKKAAHAAIIEMEAWKSFARQAREEKETERAAQQARRAHGSELDDEYAARVFAQARASRDLLGGVEDLIDRPGVSDVSELCSLRQDCVAVDTEGHNLKAKGFEEDKVLLIAICDGTRVMSRVPYYCVRLHSNGVSSGYHASRSGTRG